MTAAILLLSGFPPAVPAEDAPVGSPRAGMEPAEATPRPAEAIVYYFHRTLRCETCLTIEAYIDEALRTHFADALADGRLQWLPTNIEEPENAHFEKDFSLEFSSAILVDLDGERPVSWSNLEKIWDLVETEDEFVAYIRDRVQPVLDPEGE